MQKRNREKVYFRSIVFENALEMTYLQRMCQNLLKIPIFSIAEKRSKRVKYACFDYFSKNDSLRVCYSGVVIIVIYSRNDAQNEF